MPDAQTETPNEAGREPTSSEVQKQLEELEQHEDDPGAANDTFDKKINEVDQSARKRWEDMSGRLLDINRAIAGDAYALERVQSRAATEFVREDLNWIAGIFEDDSDFPWTFREKLFYRDRVVRNPEEVLSRARDSIEKATPGSSYAKLCEPYAAIVHDSEATAVALRLNPAGRENRDLIERLKVAHDEFALRMGKLWWDGAEE